MIALVFLTLNLLTLAQPAPSAENRAYIKIIRFAERSKSIDVLFYETHQSPPKRVSLLSADKSKQTLRQLSLTRPVFTRMSVVSLGHADASSKQRSPAAPILTWAITVIRAFRYWGRNERSHSVLMAKATLVTK